MKIGIPTLEENAECSRVASHFGRAPCLALVDIESEICQTSRIEKSVRRRNRYDTAGKILEMGPDIVLCRSLGEGALNRLSESGIKVYRVKARTVCEAVISFGDRNCEIIDNDEVCSGHRHT